VDATFAASDSRFQVGHRHGEPFGGSIVDGAEVIALPQAVKVAFDIAAHDTAFPSELAAVHISAKNAEVCCVSYEFAA
jgi:hypothetical protein